MVEIIASIVFIGSAAGAITFVVKKMPAADQLPENPRLTGFFGTVNGWVVAKLKKTRYFKDFSWIDFVQKRLLKARLIVMKAENKINDYMVKLRKHADDQKGKDEALLDNYWHDLKTVVKAKKPMIEKGVRSLESEAAEFAETLSVKVGELVSGGKEIIEEVKANRAEPMIGRVVMPDDVAEKTSPRQKKKRSGSKKRKSRDPFRW